MSKFLWKYGERCKQCCQLFKMGDSVVSIRSTKWGGKNNGVLHISCAPKFVRSLSAAPPHKLKRHADPV